jgi:hypothetical protein
MLRFSNKQATITEQEHLPTAIAVTGALFVAFALLLMPYSTADAAVGVRIQPIKVSTTLDKGEEAVGFIELTNESDEVESVIIEASVEDFVPLEGGSNISFVPRTEGLTTAADWITLDVPDSFELARGEKTRVKYTIKTPEDAEPGSHFSVVFFKALKKDDSGQLKVGTRVGSLFFITVPGNYLQKGDIEDFTAPGFVDEAVVPFKIHFKNTGTVHFEPKGTIFVKNIFNKTVAEIPVQGQVVLPTGARDLTAAWVGSKLLLGRYTATLSIFDGEGEEMTASGVTFWAFPIKQAAMFFGLLLLIYLVLRFVRRNVNISINVGNKDK